MDSQNVTDGYEIRRSAVDSGTSLVTNIKQAMLLVEALHYKSGQARSPLDLDASNVSRIWQIWQNMPIHWQLVHPFRLYRYRFLRVHVHIYFAASF